MQYIHNAFKKVYKDKTGRCWEESKDWKVKGDQNNESTMTSLLIHPRESCGQYYQTSSETKRTIQCEKLERDENTQVSSEHAFRNVTCSLCTVCERICPVDVCVHPVVHMGTETITSQRTEEAICCPTKGGWVRKLTFSKAQAGK